MAKNIFFEQSQCQMPWRILNIILGNDKTSGATNSQQ